MENAKFTAKIDDTQQYFNQARERVRRQADGIRAEMLADKNIWGQGESIRTHEDSFDALSGSISFKEGDLSTDFFRNPARLDVSKESRKNRGMNYYICINPLRNTPAEKLNTIQNDITDLTKALARENVGWKEKAALLDYIKQYALTLYHAVQYPLRFGVILPSRHEAVLKEVEKAAIKAVSDFYNHLLGHEVNTDGIKMLDNALQKAKRISMQTEYFKMQELDHPVIILGNGYGNAAAYPETGVVIGIPSGGTQLAIATKLCMEKGGSKPELAFVPISTHSAKKPIVRR